MTCTTLGGFPKEGPSNAQVKSKRELVKRGEKG